MQATNRESQRSRYDSANSLCNRPTAKTITATPKYDALLEYSAALEEQVTYLQTTADNESSAAVQTVVRNFADSATTVHIKNSMLVE